MAKTHPTRPGKRPLPAPATDPEQAEALLVSALVDYLAIWAAERDYQEHLENVRKRRESSDSAISD